jgi:3-dehydroquinate dehydratase/shikimate dehydrogenase
MKRYRICLSLYGTTGEIEQRILESPDADLFEIRIDLSEKPDPRRLRKTTQKPLIFTAHDRPDLLKPYAAVADYVDAGTSGFATGIKRIASFHGTDENPGDIWRKLDGDVRKIVLNTPDYTKLRQAIEINSRGNAVCFGMGEVARFSRIVSLFRGALWSYASPTDRPTADGQFNLNELRSTYQIHRFSEAPDIFGILGNPVAHSKSPEFHNRRFADEKRNWIYLPFHCEDLAGLLELAPRFGVKGFSITHPYKERVIPFLHSRTPEVDCAKACNTICWKNAGWHGANTDTAGVLAVLDRLDVSLPRMRVMILGAGGSARAVASIIAGQARDVIILNRSVEKAKVLAQEFGARAGSLNDFAKYDYDLLFQTTSIGMRRSESPIDVSLLKPRKKVAEILYEPSETMLLQSARAIGCETVNGEVWFEAQAEAQYRWWKSK